MATGASQPEPSAKDWFLHGEACRKGGDLASALDAFRRSLKSNPRVAAPWVGLSQVLETNGQHEDARECLRNAARASPKDAMVRCKLARSHQSLGHVEEAHKEYEIALKLQPGSAAVRFGLGQLLEELGDWQAAAEQYRIAIERDPCAYEALANLLGLGKEVEIAHEIALARQLMPQLDERGRALLGYGLGKALEREKAYDDAHAAFDAANAARRAQAGSFDRNAFDRRIESMIRLFSLEFFARRKDWGCTSERPIFIVGLPRSGTSLTEQILASHPDCFGAGELGVLADLATGTPDRLGSEAIAWPDCAPDLSSEHAAALGKEYCTAAHARAPQDMARVVDKQPLNFWHLGLIAIALPHARIVHCTRDIRDCGLSIFTQNFSLQQTWATDLGDIAHYWRGYRRLMAHFVAYSGLQVHEMRYEATVSNIEGQARQLLEFAGLNWDERVLTFHETRRAVQTPSRWQVRQPLYQTAKERWRLYEGHLDPLIQAAEEAE